MDLNDFLPVQSDLPLDQSNPTVDAPFGGIYGIPYDTYPSSQSLDAPSFRSTASLESIQSYLAGIFALVDEVSRSQKEHMQLFELLRQEQNARTSIPLHIFRDKFPVGRELFCQIKTITRLTILRDKDYLWDPKQRLADDVINRLKVHVSRAVSRVTYFRALQGSEAVPDDGMFCISSIGRHPDNPSCRCSSIS
jgi:hypothetical protein